MDSAGPSPQELAALTATLSAVADALYRIDAEPECRLLQEPDALEGVSAHLARSVADAFARIWVDYPRARELNDGGGTATPEFAELVQRLDADTRRILDAASQIGSALAMTVPRVEVLEQRLAVVEEDAAAGGALDAQTSADLVNARRLVEHLAREITRDPLSVDLGPASDAIDRVGATVTTLAELRDALPSNLAAARSTLDELRRLITEGASALASARQRIAAPTGLLEPLDLGALDDGERALGPWLERLEAEEAAGRWYAAARGLEQWQRVAAEWRERASEIAAANDAPVRHRNELRGLLDAYRAKVSATGRAEDRTLTELFQRARDALYTAPCDLARAEELVNDYLKGTVESA